MPYLPDLSSQPTQVFFFGPTDSQLHHFLSEAHKLVRGAPEILDRIAADLQAHARKKKILREADRRFRESQTADLPALQIELRPIDPGQVSLETGRPRLEPYGVYLFLMLRGFVGGCKDQNARLLLEESITVHMWLAQLGLGLPPASTWSENLNAVSNATRAFVHRQQLRFFLSEGLDDFQSLYLDSTATAAHSAWPTDSGLIAKLVERICRAGGKLKRLGVPNMNPSGLEELQSDVRALHRQIGFGSGKPKSQGLLRKLYYHLLRRARRACKRFGREIDAIQAATERRSDLLPSQRLWAEELIGLLREDVALVGKAVEACERRVLGEEKVPSDQKVISLSDPSAAFIVKGGWETVVGYRPQLGRSGAGFVSALRVPLGNAADSGQLVEVVLDHWEGSGVLPRLVSSDDGYSSQAARQDLLETGVAIVSISGAKGKKITPAEQWNSAAYRWARAQRSAVESLVFTLKDGYAFGELSRRHLDNVRAELLEKVLAYNLCQALRVRERHKVGETATRAA
jgi:IS5 family transposase